MEVISVRPDLISNISRRSRHHQPAAQPEQDRGRHGQLHLRGRGHPGQPLRGLVQGQRPHHQRGQHARQGQRQDQRKPDHQPREGRRRWELRV